MTLMMIQWLRSMPNAPPEKVEAKALQEALGFAGAAEGHSGVVPSRSGRGPREVETGR